MDEEAPDLFNTMDSRVAPEAVTDCVCPRCFERVVIPTRALDTSRACPRCHLLVIFRAPEPPPAAATGPAKPARPARIPVRVAHAAAPPPTNSANRVVIAGIVLSLALIAYLETSKLLAARARERAAAAAEALAADRAAERERQAEAETRRRAEEWAREALAREERARQRQAELERQDAIAREAWERREAELRAAAVRREEQARIDAQLAVAQQAREEEFARLGAEQKEAETADGEVASAEDDAKDEKIREAEKEAAEAKEKREASSIAVAKQRLKGTVSNWLTARKKLACADCKGTMHIRCGECEGTGGLIILGVGAGGGTSRISCPKCGGFGGFRCASCRGREDGLSAAAIARLRRTWGYCGDPIVSYDVKTIVVGFHPSDSTLADVTCVVEYGTGARAVEATRWVLVKGRWENTGPLRR